jgi:transposase-like protein
METIIVPVRAVNFELPELMKGLYEQLEQSLKEKAQKALNQKLVEVVTEGLGREFHQRRHKTKGGRGLMQCQRCGTRFWRQFSRNGYRSRYLELALGRLKIELPRVRCQCGGSVKLKLEGLKPWQRWGDDVEQLIQHYSALGHSLRQMQQQLQESWHSGIGLSSLNKRLKPLAQPLLNWPKQPLCKTPPVVLLDAIWVTLLIETEVIKKDKRGRRRVVKKRVKRPLLIALGVWPEEGFYQVLDWELGAGPGEDKDSWLGLLNRLTERGLHPDFGLELFVTDGGGGLLAALQETFSLVPRQRCVFHKIRNVLAHLSLPAALSKEERYALQKQVARQLALIWQAPTRPDAEKRARQFCRAWQATQPEAVATLQRDFQDTLTCYSLQAQNRLWPAHFLRTTSLLERLNRKIRARLRKAGAFHSLTGLLVCLSFLFPISPPP